MTTLQADAPIPAPRPFAPQHPWDRYAFPAFTAILWVGIVAGFGGDIAHHIGAHEPAYPLIVHLHAAAFVAWLVLFTVQVALVRTRRLMVHRRLGFAMLGLAAIMVVLGPAAGFHVLHARLGTPRSDPSFVAVQLGGILTFGPLVAAAAVLRKQGAAHKRLMLLALIGISDAGFARWLAPAIGAAIGGLQLGPFTSNFVPEYLCTVLLVVGLGAYDIATRGRLQTAYVAGAVVTLGLAAVATALYVSPGFAPVALHLVGG